jgi:hypothetical protein
MARNIFHGKGKKQSAKEIDFFLVMAHKNMFTIIKSIACNQQQQQQALLPTNK